MNREAETGNVRLKCNTRKRLGEKICGIYDARSVIDDEEFRFNVGANEMITNVDVFGLAMVGIIDRERFCTIVVGTDSEGCGTGDLKLLNRLTKPDSFLNCTCKSDVFGFSGRESNAVLFFC